MYMYTCALTSCSTWYDIDDGRDEWQEEVYENQARYPLSGWPGEEKSYWTNIVSSRSIDTTCVGVGVCVCVGVGVGVGVCVCVFFW